MLEELILITCMLINNHAPHLPSASPWFVSLSACTFVINLLGQTTGRIRKPQLHTFLNQFAQPNYRADQEAAAANSLQFCQEWSDNATWVMLRQMIKLVTMKLARQGIYCYGKLKALYQWKQYVNSEM